MKFRRHGIRRRDGRWPRKAGEADLVSALVADELRRRQYRLLERRHKLARFRDPERSLDTFDFDFKKKMHRALVYERRPHLLVRERRFWLSW